ncbi:MAG: metal ABC transporter substrate-binding protein [Arachnia sp.]
MDFKRARLPLLVALAASLALAGCGAAEPAGKTGVKVAAAFYPLEFAVHSVAGDAVDLTPLTTPGVEAHDVELTPRQVAAVVDSDLIVYLSGFQPAVDEAVKQADPAKVLDVAQFADLKELGEESHADGDHAGADHGDIDPHFWLDPMRLAVVTDAIAERLAAVAPEHASTFISNAKAAHTALEALDTEFSTGLHTCVRRDLFTSHSAFGYLAMRYGLEQVSVVGISPNVEPSGARIAEVQKLAREHGATTIFFETAASDAVAKSIAQDLGLQTAVLDPIESVTDQSAGQDYPAIMRANLAAIEKANDCG